MRQRPELSHRPLPRMPVDYQQAAARVQPVGQRHKGPVRCGASPGLADCTPLRHCAECGDMATVVTLAPILFQACACSA